MIEQATDILISFKNKLIEKKFYFEETKNTRSFNKTQIEINKIELVINLLIEKFNNQLEQEKQINKLIETCQKLELICILFGIDNFNYYLSYKKNDLLELVKENREANIVRIPLQLFDKKPKYKFKTDKNGRLIFNGKVI